MYIGFNVLLFLSHIFEDWNDLALSITSQGKSSTSGPTGPATATYGKIQNLANGDDKDFMDNDTVSKEDCKIIG